MPGSARLALRNGRANPGVLALLLVAAVLGSQGRALAAEDAGTFLVELSQRAVDELSEPGLSAAEQERRFRSLLNEGFDIPAISRFVLGRYWRRASPADQARFIATFEDLVVLRFLPLFSEYSGEKLRVGLIRPFKNNPNFVNVTTELLRQNGEPIQVDWRVRRRDGAYKIVDIIAEGISIAVTLRSEYTSVLKRNGGNVGALTQELRAKIAGL